MSGPCRSIDGALSRHGGALSKPWRSLAHNVVETLLSEQARSLYRSLVEDVHAALFPTLVRSMVETCPKPVRTRSCVPSRFVVAMFEALYRSIVRRMCRSLVEALLVACLRSLAEAKFGACCRSLPKPCSQPLSQQVRSNNEASPNLRVHLISAIATHRRRVDGVWRRCHMCDHV